MTDAPLTMPRYPGQAQGSAPDVPANAEEVTSIAELPPSRRKKILRTVGWIFLGSFCMIFFTLIKLPEDRIKGLVQGNLAQVLGQGGISFTAGETKISYLFGITYVMQDVTLNFPPPEPSTHIEKITVSPSLLSLLYGKLGATITIKNGDGEMTIAGGIRGARVSASIDAQQFDIGRVGLLKLVANVSGAAVLNGKADFSSSTEDLTETNATVQMDLRKIVINSQSIQGFTIPRLAMSEGRIDVDVDHGKGQVKTLRIGRPDSATDDIKATLGGDILLGKTLQNSTMNLKAVFSLSQSLLKSFVLLDAILAQGKQPNGDYSYRLQGPLLSPNPIPAGAS